MQKRLISLVVALACITPAVAYAQGDRALLTAAQARKEVLVKDMATTPKAWRRSKPCWRSA
jgi:glutamate carboxypeptidase